MENSLGKSLKTSASVYFTDEGTLSVNIKIISDDELCELLYNKVVDESRSIVGLFTKKIHDSNFQSKSYVMLSGIFQFVYDWELINSPEEITKRAIKALAEQLVKVSDNPCEYCANRDKCNAEAASLGEAWQEPDTDVCARHVIHYFLSQAKND